MSFSEPLASEIRALVDSSEPVERAFGHNLVFEGRVSASRRDEYEAAMARRLRRGASLVARHQRYVVENVYGTVDNRHVRPAAFGPGNELATLDLTAKKLKELKLVRVEDMRWPLRQMKRPAETEERTFERLREVFADYRTTEGDAAGRNAARNRLRGMLGRWNGRRDGRPIFATFLDSAPITAAVADPAGCFERLRDLLGLGHLCGPDRVPVALMIYTVETVLKQMNRLPLLPDGEDRPDEIEKPHAFAAPTALDTPLFQWFFPSPRDLGNPNGSYGHTVDLTCPTDGVLPAEVLHAPLPTLPSHLYALGWIDAPLPPHDLAAQRDTHLSRLRRVPGGAGFGDWMVPR